jgi:hypothetical protein
MRRALVLVSVLAATMLGTGLTLAAATAAAPAPPEIEREVAFELHAEGFKVNVYVNNNDGDVTATLFVTKGPQVAFYSVPAKVTAERVTAKFGVFGELDYAFRPKGKGSLECLGASDLENEAELEGIFTFTGQQEYVHVEAIHVEGTMHLYPVPKQCAKAPRARRVVPYHPSYSGEGVTLQAKAGSLGEGKASLVSVLDQGGGRRHRIAIFAYLAERQEGVIIARGGADGGALKRVPLEPRRRHRDPAAAGSAQRLGQVHPARRQRPRDLERLVDDPDPRRRTGEAGGRQILRLHSQRRARGRVIAARPRWAYRYRGEPWQPRIQRS